jgi:GNAT superfamily N-acetyltransferase
MFGLGMKKRTDHLRGLHFTGAYGDKDELRDGRPVIIRAIRPGDKDLLGDTLRKMSSESLYLRLFSGKRNFSDDELKQITAVDFVNIVALVAVLEKDGIAQIVGGGRYVRLEPCGTGQSAEVAFLVDDAHQGLGIGSRLFKHLVAIARESRMTHFEAEVLRSNVAMLGLFDRSGLLVLKTMSRDSVHVTIELTAVGGAS